MLKRLLLQFSRPYRAELGLVVVLQMVATLATLYLPSLNADIIDRGVALGDTHEILVRGGQMLAVTAINIACVLAAVYFGARTAMSYGRDLRAAIFARVTSFSSREIASLGVPSLITRNTNDVQQIQMLVHVSCTMIVAAPITCLGGIVMALREDLVLSRLLLVAIPLLGGSIAFIVSRMVPLFRAMQPRIDSLNRLLREQITGMRVVRAFVRESTEAARFGAANEQLTEIALRAGKLQALMFPTVLFMFNASNVAVSWFGAERVASGGIEIGGLIAFLSYLMQILFSVMMVTFLAVMIPRAAVCAERVGEVLDTTSSVAVPVRPIAPSAERGRVEVLEAEFRYPGARDAVLSEISFTAQPGQVTAIVGSTGAGKTTLVSLLARLIDSTSGEIRLSGTNVRDLDPELLWSRIGYVPQRPYLFSGTVASNLRYGNPHASDEQLWQALEVAQARDFVEAFPQKLDAPIAQGGTNVSGGQRQRLSIARALLREPDVLLFDDSFSALDLVTDANLRAALRANVKNANIIIVAQRVSGIRDADQILVLDAGRLVGRGRHAELMQSCPTYQEIVASQMTAEEAA